ncbi:MAG: NlpC/P60 family protein [Alphaproteobacteria bacterium]|nr:NlpC/P60 family protein [Alphaproteobacteria bacterium]
MASQTSRKSAILDRAERLLGTPYAHMGRSRRGIDCVGLLLYALDIDEREIPEAEKLRTIAPGYYDSTRWRYNRKDPSHREACVFLRDALTKRLLYANIRDLMPGDVLLMAWKIREEGLGDHVAIYAGRNQIIHADMHAGVVRDDIEDDMWRRIVAAYRSRE